MKFALTVSVIFSGLLSAVTGLPQTATIPGINVGECFEGENCQGDLLIDGSSSATDCMCMGGGSYRFDDGTGQILCANVQSRTVTRTEVTQGGPQRALEAQGERELGGGTVIILGVIIFLLLCEEAHRRELSVLPPGCNDGQAEFVCGTEISGEPHIKQLVGGWYDYHGECDLVFARAPDFADGLGLLIHARTKIRYDYSYIENASIMLGNDVLEVTGFGHYLINGISGADLSQVTMAGNRIVHIQVSENLHRFEIQLEGGNTISINTMKDIVSVKITPGEGFFGKEMRSWLSNNTGLIGSMSTTKMIGRDGRVIEDPNAMGQEWQVRESDPKIFVNQDRAPQYPEKCILPDPAAKQERRRRLGESVSHQAAEKACEHWHEDEREGCISDLMATGDVDLAFPGAY